MVPPTLVTDANDRGAPAPASGAGKITPLVTLFLGVIAALWI